MRVFQLLVFILMLSCSPPPSTQSSQLALFKEAFWKSKNVFSMSKDIDYRNDAEIDFFQDYEGQLVELRFDINKMSSLFYTLNNNDYLYKGHAATPEIQELKIKLNGTDITSCLIEECNLTNCSSLSSSPLTKFSGLLSSDRVFLNITKLSLSSRPSCAGLNILLGNKNTISFIENYPGTLSNQTGGRVNAEVFVYNRPYRISDVVNAFIER